MTLLPLLITTFISTSSSSFIYNSSLQVILENHLTESGNCQNFANNLRFLLLFPNKLMTFISFNSRENLTIELELTWGIITGKFGSSPWINQTEHSPPSLGRAGRQLTDSNVSRLWPNARVPYEFADTIDFSEWQIMQNVFRNISSVTNIEFVPRCDMPVLLL